MIGIIAAMCIVGVGFFLLLAESGNLIVEIVITVITIVIVFALLLWGAIMD